MLSRKAMTAWEHQLDKWGAVREGDTTHFGAPVQERTDAINAAVLTTTGSLGRIRISGQDHRAFLQAQLTSNIKNLSPTRIQPSAWLTPKGQVRFVLIVLPHGNTIDLVVQASRTEEILDELKKFVLRAKVSLDHISPEEPMLGLVGPCAHIQAKARIGHPTAENDGATTENDVTYWRLSGLLPRYLLTGSHAALIREADLLRIDVPLGGDEAWRLASLEAGVPSGCSEISERYIPQMLNLDTLGAVSFDKGCYPGQEIVARTKYRGRLKRRLYLSRIVGGKPSVLASLYAQGSNQEKQGEIVDYAPGPEEGTWSLLSVANVDLPSPVVTLEGSEPRLSTKLELVDHGSRCI